MPILKLFICRLVKLFKIDVSPSKQQFGINSLKSVRMALKETRDKQVTHLRLENVISNELFTYDCSHVALIYIAQLGEHCTGIAEVMGLNPARSLKFFSGLSSSSVTAALAFMTVITQLLLWDKLPSVF